MTTDNGVALAVRDATELAPRFVVSLDDLRLQLRELEQFKRDIMVESVDYGTIPGTPKPTLLKPGAEKLTLAFGLAPTFEPASRVEDWQGGFFHYEERCVLTNKRTGDVVASANGSANSKEPRYRWRDAKPTCPDCGFDLRRSKKRDDGEDGGWYCWSKIGGCGAQWPKETVKSVGRMENPEPYELTNTILKMAQKRALVAAVLIATGGSGIWTQDIEDMPSVSGEGFAPSREREVVDVTPTRQPPADAVPEMVISADNRVWKRWLQVLAEAQGLGVPAKEIRLPIPLEKLKAQANTVLEAIAQKRAWSAAEYKRIHGSDDDGSAFADQPRTAPRDVPEDESDEMVTTKRHPLWAAWSAAAALAEADGIPPAPYTLPIRASVLQASVDTLRELVDAKRAEAAPA